MDKEGMAALPVDIPVALDPRRLIMTPEQRDELRWCNAIMQQQKMPGVVHFLPVQPDDLILRLGIFYDFPSAEIVLASTYFQRLIAARRNLALRAAGNPLFRDYVTASLDGTDPVVRAMREGALPPNDCPMYGVLMVCLNLALKLHSGFGCPVHKAMYTLYQVSEGDERDVRLYVVKMEEECLKALDWRLGPCFWP